MTKSFAPSLQHFQKDIERLLTREGKREKNERGQTVYRGYQAAVDQMFHVYLDKEAFAPLVAEFRKWNWEWSYPDKVSEELVEKTRILLLDSLYRLRTYASELHRTSDVGQYAQMIARVEARKKA